MASRVPQASGPAGHGHRPADALRDGRAATRGEPLAPSSLSSSLSFSPLGPEDIVRHGEALERMERIYPACVRLSAGDYRDILETPGSVGLLALRDGRLIGNAVGCPLDEEELAGFGIVAPPGLRSLYLFNITIIPEEQGHGHGARLMEAFLCRCARSYDVVLAHFRQNASYRIARRYRIIEERAVSDWMGTGETFIYCVIDVRHEK